MKAPFILTTFLFFAFFGYAQRQGSGGSGHYFPQQGWNAVPLVGFPTPDIPSLKAEDRILDSLGDHPWRFGFNHATSLNCNSHGVWIPLKNKGTLWLLRIQSPGALSLNLTFDHTEIPEGNELYVYNPEKSFILGKFTAAHLYQQQLGTELIPGDEIILEYFVPEGNPRGFLQLSTVTHGYRTPKEFMQKAFGSSGNCNFNVNCPQGAAWQQERNGVVMLVSGSNGFCSGSLINNTLNNGKPYVLTANHCYSNPASWIFRFNWQSPTCANPPAEPSFQSLSGAVLRARASASDFCLVEITGGLQGNTVPAAIAPYFNGWDNSGNTPSSAVGIHHPAGDIKKVSRENDPLISTTFGSCPANSHWGVTGWDEGVTEGGSSGSPLFDQNHRIVGQLHGGASACGAASLSDEYGKMSYSWNPQNSDSTNQLKYWLDPHQSNASFVNGYDPTGGVPVQVDPAVAAVGGVSGTFCSDTVTPTVTLANGGAVTLTSATLTYGFDGNNNLSYNWSGSLAQWQSTTVSLPPAALSNGAHTFQVSVTNPNTGVDENNLNNTQSGAFYTVLNGQSVALALTLDCYGSETSWELLTAAGLTLYSGNGYSDNTPGLLTETWCLDAGCYQYIIHDSYGDGIYGLPWCQSSGSVLISSMGNPLASIDTANANFGNQATLTFCITNALNAVEATNYMVHPNPATHEVVWSSSLPVLSYELVDLQGKTIAAAVVQALTEFSISLEGINSGMYVVRCALENGRRVQLRIVKN